MSSINFNDYTNYANYDTGYDFSALMGGTANSSGNLLSDYASIKNGSYGKLMKAYYAKQDAESASASGDSRQKLTLINLCLCGLPGLKCNKPEYAKPHTIWQK